jgi:hypothetical protein
LREGVIVANQAGRTPFAARRKETPAKIEDHPCHNVSDSPGDDSKICRLPSKISINIDHLCCLEIKSMLTGAVINFFMETITFIPDDKLAEHYLIASDMWDFIVLYTRYPSKFQHELAKQHLLNHWKKLKYGDYVGSLYYQSVIMVIGI